MRSTGLVYTRGDDLEYKLVTSSSKKINNEELIVYNVESICDFINICRPNQINLEGLSFGSASSSKDILAGNFWTLRVEIHKRFDIPVNIIPVLTWRSPLFDKAERQQHKAYEKQLKELKASIKGIKSRKDKQAILAENNEIVNNANIKYLTWKKLPANIASQFEDVGLDKGGYDLTDAYFLAKHSI